MIITFVTILNRIKKKAGREATEVAIFIISLQIIKKVLKPKVNFINEELKAKIPSNIYDSLYI